MDYRPKKGLDIWLNEKGFYRKHVAMDETCFFRAVSDQIYNTQIYHEDIRKKCVKFGSENHTLFKDILSDSAWREHLDKLEKHFVVCGDIEIKILSKMLKYDFIVIDSDNFTIKNITNDDFEQSITLCKMKDNHYDSICSKETIDNAGFCQSILYKILYENIFKFENVDDIVQTMLYPYDEELKKNPYLFDAFDLSEPPNKEDISIDPPFPYKVAKALDPNQYRNIEFDSWNQIRKDLRLKDWYLGGDDFKIGTKCLLVVENNALECYIQELKYQLQESVCLVYVVEWATKEVVKREELMPMPDATPWPLPYCISRNSKTVEPPKVVPEEPKPPNRRRRNRRRNQNSNNNIQHQNNNDNRENEVSCVQGCPLVVTAHSQYVDENDNIPVSVMCKPDFNSNGFSNFLMPCENNSLVPFTGVPYENNNYTQENEGSLASEDDTQHQFGQTAGVTPCGTPAPYLVAPYTLQCECTVNMNPQMFVTTEQSNELIQQQRMDYKVTTVYAKRVEKTYANKSCYYTTVSNSNLPLLPNCPQCQPQMVPVPYYPENPQMIQPIMQMPNYPIGQSMVNHPEYQPQMVHLPNHPEYQSQLIHVPYLPEYQSQIILLPNYPEYQPQMVQLPNHSACQPQMALMSNNPEMIREPNHSEYQLQMVPVPNYFPYQPQMKQIPSYPDCVPQMVPHPSYPICQPQMALGPMIPVHTSSPGTFVCPVSLPLYPQPIFPRCMDINPVTVSDLSNQIAQPNIIMPRLIMPLPIQPVDSPTNELDNRNCIEFNGNCSENMDQCSFSPGENLLKLTPGERFHYLQQNRK